MEAEAVDASVTGKSGSTGCGCSGTIWQNAQKLVYGSREIGPYGAESRNPYPVGGLMVGINGGLSWTNATVSIADTHSESTPAEENTGQVTAGPETCVPDLVGVGYGINGGRIMGYLVGNKATTPMTYRLDDEVQFLSTAVYGFDTVVRPCWPVEQSLVPNSVCGEEQCIEVITAHPEVEEDSSVIFCRSVLNPGVEYFTGVVGFIPFGMLWIRRF